MRIGNEINGVYLEITHKDKEMVPNWLMYHRLNMFW